LGRGHNLPMFEENDLVKNLVPAVREQIKSPETPFVKKALDRLIADGEEEAEAEMMLALCLADESNRMFIDKRGFDLKRYQELLDALPELPEG